MSTISAAVFWQRFNESHRIGLDMTDDEVTAFFRSNNGHNGTTIIGEARTNRRTTVSTYSLLTGEIADMVLYWYTIRPVEEQREEVRLLVSTMRAYGRKAISLGCNLSSLRDALAMLDRTWTELKLSKEINKVVQEGKRPAIPSAALAVKEDWDRVRLERG